MKLLAILFSVLFFLPVAKGQSGVIYGTVTDEKDVPFERVSINVFQSGKLFIKKQSEKDGKYYINHLAPGIYKVEFLSNGFLKSKVIGVPVSDSFDVEINCKMISGRSDFENITVYEKPIFFDLHAFQIAIRTPIPKVVPSYINLTWSGQLKYTNFPQVHHQKQITKKHSERDFQHIPFNHFLEVLPELKTIKKATTKSSGLLSKINNLEISVLQKLWCSVDYPSRQ